MTKLNPTDFPRYFSELWGQEPFPWQRRLAGQVCSEGWPDYIDLPTASGKTACLDIAVFSLALQVALRPRERTIGRRVFFIVNRRVIVDEARERAVEIARKLQEAQPGSALFEVARALRETGGDPQAPPLDVALMRGGIVSDNRWARSITQPAIITSTIDQAGSRLLFRGYGVSDASKPLHAALIANDSLLLLDEAHISQPFVETLNAVKRYRGEDWAEQTVHTPYGFVQMTATPSESGDKVFRLDSEDQKNPVLLERHGKAKPVHLAEVAGAKGKNAQKELAKAIASRAVELLDVDRRNIAIVVNRIATARMVARQLPEMLAKRGEKRSEVHLAIGRMRPIDRDALTKTIQARVGKTSGAEQDASPMFVVATQCLEVGADFDFDAMVSECASLDALRQRFGRLNRRGRGIQAGGAVVIRGDQVKEEDDPVYCGALSKTWAWLRTLAPNDGDTVDFGVHAMDRLLLDVDISELLAPRAGAPLMFPAYLDAWAQTSPTPLPDPDVSLFLHGPERGEPDVLVCWRDDLDESEPENWVQTVSICPPSSPECMSAPLGVVRRWLAGASNDDESSTDMLDCKAPELPEEVGRNIRSAVLWRGSEQSILISSPDNLKPGDTIVLPTSSEAWTVFGHIPEDAPKDVAEQAARLSRGQILARLHPERLKGLVEHESVSALREWLVDPEIDLRMGEIRALLRAAANMVPDTNAELKTALNVLGGGEYGFEFERYPNGLGVVLRTRRPIKSAGIIPVMDDGDDMPSRVARTAPVPLGEHLSHVKGVLQDYIERLPLRDLDAALHAAVCMHDWGKADERFQALLINGDLNDAWAQPELWGKSGSMPGTDLSRRRARMRSGLPSGFRHEMLSVQLAQLAPDGLPENATQRDLALHLIAAHHGRGRPFAPVVIDENPPDVSLEPLGVSVRLPAEQRRQWPPHRLDSGIADRFWTLTRHYGWWGLAYLEAVVRLADQRASQAESEGPDHGTKFNTLDMEVVK